MASRKTKIKTNQFVVVVPWPHRYLSPNSRINWQAKAQISRRARLTAKLLAKERFGCGNQAAPIDDYIEVQLIAHPRDKRKRDEDNIIASMKATLDGIADALCVNDASFHFKELEFAETKRPPDIEVWLTWKERVK